MKTLLISRMRSVVAAAVIALTAPVAFAAEELHLYMWSEYIDPKILKDFEVKYKCKVIQDLYESNEEMIAKLQAGGSSQYDLVIPSDFVAPSMVKLGLLKPLDAKAIPNLANLKPEHRNNKYDAGNKYTVPYQWGTVGLMYNKKLAPDFTPSWSVIFAPNAARRPYVLIDSEREMIGTALKYMGKSMNTTNKTELKAAADLLIKAKKHKNFLGFEGGVGGKSKVAGGSAAYALVYSGDAYRAMAENANLGFVNPKEGAVVWVDNMAIPVKAPNAALAHKFINYILDPKVGAALSNFNHFATPNQASMAFITPADLKNPAVYPDAATLKTLENILDRGKDNRLYSELWKMVKTR
jgi:spermidine/putrescine transport system substrate-binding protein